LMPCSNSQPLIRSGDQRIWHNFASILRRNGAVSLRLGPQEAETMSRALSPSFAHRCGLARVARVWTISRASVYRSLKETPPNTITRRPGPVGGCSDANWQIIFAGK
jgi:hypothetical protein